MTKIIHAGNAIGAQGAKFIANGLCQNTSLKTLLLDG